MRIDLERIRLEGRPFTWDETVEVAPETLGRQDLVALGPVRWRGRVSWAVSGFHLTAHLEGEQTLACDRCLEPIRVPIDEDLELLVVVREPRPLAGEHELSDDDLGVLHLDEEVLDTEPLLIEQLQLQVPMKPVCRPDCKGLCPTCGADRNRADCDCRDVEVDPRWAALAELKQGN
ncbi:MAG TPA: DUF177 domain-containing protein [Thermoanaerobaculia bacterium]|nr:DUF177 domain-containing protein [Thermoanaerobaculia bacterium]